MTVRNLYNLGNRGTEELVDYCDREGIGFIPWFPLGSGKLARPGGPPDDELAQQLGTTPSQVALGWLLRRFPTGAADSGYVVGGSRRGELLCRRGHA